MKTRMWTLVIFCAAALSAYCADTGAGLAPGTYQIRNREIDKLLRPENASNANGTPIVLYSAEPWKCMTWRLQPAGESSFHLQNYLTGKTFVAKTNGARLALIQVPFDRDTSKRPAWNVIKLADGFYRIVDVKSGQDLTGSKEGLTLAPWKEKPEQQWEFIAIDAASLVM